MIQETIISRWTRTIISRNYDLALDIIGLGVFNYDFGLVTKESTVIKVW